jgi:integrase
VRAEALPAVPEAIAAYLGALADVGKSVSTIRIALAAILYGHGAAGHELPRAHPAIAAVMAGIARRKSQPIRHAAPLHIADLRAILAAIDGSDVRALRDRALLLVGFFGALRRSEIASLDVTGRSPIEIRDEGLLLRLTATKKSATTQAVAIPRRDDELCAASAVTRYLAAAGLKTGPLFRAIGKGGRVSGRRLDGASVRHILKQRTSGAQMFTPHSLRSGFITSAAKAGAPEHAIQRTSRHKSADVLRGYMRSADIFGDSGAAYLD